MFLNLALYTVLGIALYFSGVSVMEKPLEFFVIMVIVGLIDFVSMLRASSIV